MLDDAQTAALSRHAAFMQRVARLSTRGFDRMFGRNLISVRAFATSWLFSSGSLFASAGIALIQPGPSHHSWIGGLFLAVGVAFLLEGGLTPLRDPADVIDMGLRIKRRLPTFALGSAAVMVFAFFFKSHFFHLALFQVAFGDILVLATTLGFVCDVVVIVFVRWGLEVCSDLRSFTWIAAVIGLDIIMAFYVSIGPLLWVTRGGRVTVSEILGNIDVQGLMPRLGLALAWANFPDVAVALVFVALAFTALCHRLLWPVFGRSIYLAQSLGIARRSKLMTGLGLSLIGWSGWRLPGLMEGFLTHLAQ